MWNGMLPAARTTLLSYILYKAAPVRPRSRRRVFKIIKTSNLKRETYFGVFKLFKKLINSFIEINPPTRERERERETCFKLHLKQKESPAIPLRNARKTI
jgi:hypothetical protein